MKQIDINADGVNDLEIKLISITNGKASFSITKLAGAEVLSLEELEEQARKEALFDVEVSVLNRFKVVLPGDEVFSEIEVFNINNIGQVDVVVNYYISDKNTSEGRILTQGSDTLAVEAKTSFVRSLIIPIETKAGKYFFVVDVAYKDFITSSSSEFRVSSSTLLVFFQKNFGWLFIFIAVIVVAIFFYLRSLTKRVEKLERIVRKLKKK